MEARSSRTSPRGLAFRVGAPTDCPLALPLPPRASSCPSGPSRVSSLALPTTPQKSPLAPARLTPLSCLLPLCPQASGPCSPPSLRSATPCPASLPAPIPHSTSSTSLRPPIPHSVSSTSLSTSRFSFPPRATRRNPALPHPRCPLPFAYGISFVLPLQCPAFTKHLRHATRPVRLLPLLLLLPPLPAFPSPSSPPTPLPTFSRSPALSDPPRTTPPHVPSPLLLLQTLPPAPIPPPLLPLPSPRWQFF